MRPYNAPKREGLQAPRVTTNVFARMGDRKISLVPCLRRTQQRSAIRGGDAGRSVALATSGRGNDAVPRLAKDGGRKRRGNAWSTGLAQHCASLSQRKIRIRPY